MGSSTATCRVENGMGRPGTRTEGGDCTRQSSGGGRQRTQGTVNSNVNYTSQFKIGTKKDDDRNGGGMMDKELEAERDGMKDDQESDGRAAVMNGMDGTTKDGGRPTWAEDDGGANGTTPTDERRSRRNAAGQEHGHETTDPAGKVEQMDEVDLQEGEVEDRRTVWREVE